MQRGSALTTFRCFINSEYMKLAALCSVGCTEMVNLFSDNPNSVFHVNCWLFEHIVRCVCMRV